MLSFKRRRSMKSKWKESSIYCKFSTASGSIYLLWWYIYIRIGNLQFTWQNSAIMMTSSNGSFFRVAGPLWGEFTGHRWILLSKDSDASFDAFFDLPPNKRLSKQSRRRWFDTPSRSLWRRCKYNVSKCSYISAMNFGPLSLTAINYSSIELREWVNNHNHTKNKM